MVILNSTEKRPYMIMRNNQYIIITPNGNRITPIEYIESLIIEEEKLERKLKLEKINENII